jgi:hypothetical protein
MQSGGGRGVISSLETIPLNCEAYCGVTVGLSSVADLGTEKLCQSVETKSETFFFINNGVQHMYQFDLILSNRARYDIVIVLIFLCF